MMMMMMMGEMGIIKTITKVLEVLGSAVFLRHHCDTVVTLL
jgi:hypothetical protein